MEVSLSTAADCHSHCERAWTDCALKEKREPAAAFLRLWKHDQHLYIIHFQKHIHYSYPHILILLARLCQAPKYLSAGYQSSSLSHCEEVGRRRGPWHKITLLGNHGVQLKWTWTLGKVPLCLPPQCLCQQQQQKTRTRAQQCSSCVGGRRSASAAEWGSIWTS